MKNILFFYLLLSGVFLFAQKDVTVPDVSNFDSSIGSGSSVNLSNGKLNLPLKLVSLKGYKDLNVEFGIAYSGAQVSEHAKASNEIIPTGTLGLGWGMQMPKILADNKLTAARDDDQFYMFDGGSLNELIAFNKTATKIEFKSKIFKPWKIAYYPTQEKWEVVKENGYTYTYAYVDWVLYWDNWIGNSNEPATGRQGSGWSLTSVEDMYGNQIIYDYFSIMRNLSGSSSSTKRHTEATYLQSITGTLGERVELVYNSKSSNEYYEPNTNISEPDAYQEMYETKYLKEVQAYDTNNALLYKYTMDYTTIGSGEYTKRLLDKVDFVNANNDVQNYREFEYDTNINSEFYGHLKHQILPTKGRISYQYATKETEIDQIFDTSGNNESSFVIQKNYVLKFTFLQSGLNEYVYMYRYDWDGTTWKGTDLGHVWGIQRHDGYLDMQVLARENFYAILYRVNYGNYYRKAYGLKDDGVTWDDFSSGIFHTPGAGIEHAVSLIGGEDFYAIGNPKQDRINMYRWDGTNWEQFYQYNNTPGTYYYTASNNYVIQHNKDTGIDTVKMFYYDITNQVQQKNFTSGINMNTSGSGNYDSYWYGSNSFAQVNANANPEYFIRWDKNYNFLARDTAPFGAISDDIKTQSFYNSYYTSSKKDWDWNSSWHNDTYVTRYTGNGNWIMNSVTTSPFIYDKNLTGFGSDFYVHPSDFYHPDPFNPITASHNDFHIFNANTGLWNTTSMEVQGNTSYNNDKLSFDAFAGRYAFANSELYKLNNDFSISNLGMYPTNTIFSMSDGGNSLYISSRNGGNSSGSAFAKILTLTKENTIEELSLPSGYYLRKNAYKNFHSHAAAYGTFVVHNGSNYKIYRLLDGELQYNSEGNTVQKDVVIVKEIFDPVISRKQRQYFCYGNAKPSKDNMRVFYGNVAQQNDLEGLLGGSVTYYDIGDTDIRRQGLPNKLQSYDSDFNLLSEQENYWNMNTDLDGRYYINLTWKKTKSFEGDRELNTMDRYTYMPYNGLLKSHIVDDSEGNTQVSTTKYLYEEFPEVLDDNLLQPVIQTKQYNDFPGFSNDQYVNATTVKWDLSGVPFPKQNYAWNGTGSTNFDFNDPPDNYRGSQEIMLLGASGNILQEKNRSEVITSYIYGYDNKRLVAKIEGATHSQAMAQINTSIVNNPANDDQLTAELQNLRDGLPNAYVTSYTYHLGIGLTTMTDIRGRTTKYIYDNYYRLSHIIDHDGHILKKNEHQYREAPFNYEALSNDVLDCSDIFTETTGNPDGTEPVPLSLHLTKQSGNDMSALFVLSVSGVAESGYTLTWSYNTVSGNVSDFPYNVHPTNSYLSSSNPDCNDGVLSVMVQAVDGTGNALATSNIVNHTYTSSPECGNQ